MRLAAVALLALVGCGNPVGDDAPIITGGAGGGASGGDGGGVRDSAIDTPGEFVMGKVCLVTDPRLLSSMCSTDQAGMLVVKLESYMTDTDAMGAFQITNGGDETSLWDVTSKPASTQQIVHTIQKVSLNTTIPAFTIGDYADFETANGVAEMTETTGSVFLHVVQAGAPLAGVTAELPGGASASGFVFYDNDANEQIWTTGADTDSNGVIWAPDLLATAGTLDITVQPPTPADPITVTVPVAPNTLTFATVVVPPAT